MSRERPVFHSYVYEHTTKTELFLAFLDYFMQHNGGPDQPDSKILRELRRRADLLRNASWSWYPR